MADPRTAGIVRAHSTAATTPEAIRDLLAHLEGFDPVLIVFFASIAHDGVAICDALKRFAPGAKITGCSTAGEFTDASYGTGGVALLAFSASKIKRVATALVTYENGVAAGVRAATQKLSAELGADLRELDPDRYVGFIFNEGLHLREDEVDETLGEIAPLLSFVGGSAGDDWQMKAARLYENGKVSEDACVLTLMEVAVPFKIIKTSSFDATSTTMRLGKVNGRSVGEINGKPALQGYAEAVGVDPEKMDHQVFGANPLGVMIEGEAWVRSVIGVLPDGSLNFGARMIEGAELALLTYKDLVGDASGALGKAAAELGGKVSGAVLFNCAHRCLAINAMKLQDPFSAALTAQGYPIAGFHCYGEDWIVHLNQTMVGILFG